MPAEAACRPRRDSRRNRAFHTRASLPVIASAAKQSSRAAARRLWGRACFQCGPTDLRLMLSEYDCPRPASPLRVYRMKAGRLAAVSTGSRLDHAESSGRCDGCLAKTTLFEQTTILVFGALAAARGPTEHVQLLIACALSTSLMSGVSGQPCEIGRRGIEQADGCR